MANWTLYLDRAAWMKGQAFDDKVNGLLHAKATADAMGARMIEGASATWAKGPDGKWRKA